MDKGILCNCSTMNRWLCRVGAKHHYRLLYTDYYKCAKHHYRLLYTDYYKCAKHHYRLLYTDYYKCAKHHYRLLYTDYYKCSACYYSLTYVPTPLLNVVPYYYQESIIWKFSLNKYYKLLIIWALIATRY